MRQPLLQIIIGSTRPGRVGPSVAEWIAAAAAAHGHFAVEVVDLAEVNLPMFNEPRHPRLRQYEYQHTKDWSATITRAVQMLKQVLTTLKITPVFEAVNIPFVQQFLDSGRTLQPNEVMTEAATA